MKKRKKKRYLNQQQILLEIDKYKQKMEAMVRLAEREEEKAEIFLTQERIGGFVDAEFLKDKAQKLRRSAFRIEQVKLPYLKQKLSEFDTLELPGMETDGSIQA